MFFRSFENTINYYYIKMAKDILSNLGQEERTYCASLSMGGGYYEDIVYNNYDLTIVQPDLRRYHNQRDRNYNKHYNIYIKYDGEVMLDKQTYLKGPWEEVLQELHKKIPVILRDKEAQRQLKEKHRHIINIIDEINHLSNRKPLQIGDLITISRHDDEDDYYRVTYYSYEVTYNANVVFRASYNLFRKETNCTIYIPGIWEEELEKYLCQLKINKQYEHEQAIRKHANDSLNKLKRMQ